MPAISPYYPGPRPCPCRYARVSLDPGHDPGEPVRRRQRGRTRCRV